MKMFEEIYKELENADNNELDTLWQEAKKQNEKMKKIAIIICLIIDMFFIIMVLKNVTYLETISFLYIMIFALMMNIIIFAIITMCGKNSKKQRQLTAKYKQVVISKIMSNFYDNLKYLPQNGMPEYIYEQLQYEYYNQYKSDDYFEAQINNKYNIQMAEVLTQEERTYKDSEGETQTETVTKFHGLFAKIIMDKSINSELKIMKDRTISKKDRLNMDSSEFEKHFDVKASNKIIGMQLLTADVMEELVQFENKANMKFDIVMKENEIYLRFHSGAMFEVGNFKKGVLNKEVIQKYFYMLKLTYDLSNKLINVINDAQI